MHACGVAGPRADLSVAGHQTLLTVSVSVRAQVVSQEQVLPFEYQGTSFLLTVAGVLVLPGHQTLLTVSVSMRAQVVSQEQVLPLE